ncbi:PREDICTED: malonyl-coenzyme:anthocyanin 5-O-glucoside-6'''-O-malonyltransferase-like [Ipomoea nil]|uniref:malonyl-coenzyme:anthocyanin 5-O-glucoside-6'''-O-malonyltransferase-like n=1 Tax=Ipomoea nil TaxID=35883 RepID=UPI000901B33E|nr:PREDICTED: malonyl-coenzyme:anthocyanin 5-O-glucoside-6'''-O-malonyltransferase-like [Ipomoea nil]
MATLISHREVAPAGNAAEMSLPLTFFDIPWLFYFRMVRRLLFYRLPISRESFLETTIPNLMASLSLTLKHFLPLAGNLVSPSDSSTPPELRYFPGDSVPVAFAESAGDFDSLVANHPRDVNHFYPLVARLQAPEPAAGEQIIIPVLSIQVTLFPGFGICISTTHHHVVGDGNTMNSFTKAWAMINKLGGDGEFIAEKSESKSVPFYDRTIVKDPYGARDKMFGETKKKLKVELSEAEVSTPRIDKVRATYIMRRTDIEKIKNLVTARQRPRTIHVSAFTVTCGYVWSGILKAKAAIGEPTAAEEIFVCSADCRTRLNPPLPASYFGNCVVSVCAKSKIEVLVGDDGFLAAAELIGEAIEKGVKNDEEWILNGELWFSEFEEAVEGKGMGVAGYPRIDLYGADFGWGKAEKIEYVSIDGGDSMSLCKCRDSEGDLEVGLAMPRTRMEAFASIFADGLSSL